MPPTGAGLQVHLEDLAAYLLDHDRCDAPARWAQLFPAYQDLAATSGRHDSTTHEE